MISWFTRYYCACAPNVVYIRVMRRLCHHEWNWLWNWRCVNQHSWDLWQRTMWSRRVTSDFNSVLRAVKTIQNAPSVQSVVPRGLRCSRGIKCTYPLYIFSACMWANYKSHHSNGENVPAVAQWIRPHTLNHEIPGLDLLAEAVVPSERTYFERGRKSQNLIMRFQIAVKSQMWQSWSLESEL